MARTLGAHLDEVFRATMARHAKAGDPADYTTLKFNARKGTAAWTKVELAAWMDYQQQVRTLRVVDPACGSGVFLVAAFEFLRSEYDRINKKLAELRGAAGQGDVTDIDSEILSTNLYGVDVNEESVEITKLSLWVKTARRGKILDSLDHTIRIGDSLIEDMNHAYLKHGFDWQTAFPEVFASGGFDVVIGNPPYVRMELIKEIKPYLQGRFEVVADRADLYAYFFERGVRLLKPGGRLGYISSSTFFKTGSGEPLRRYLLRDATLETITDFGDLQVFGGVTTYPAILTLRKAPPPPDHALAFVKLTALPKVDFDAVFDADARPFPQAKLGPGSWELENPAVRALREKIVAGKRTLKEVYGSPLYGIKTGLNEAFVVDRATRDRLILDDPKSADLLKPFLEGKDLKRWRAEPRDLWLIYIPKNTIEIDDYPAIRVHLSPFRDLLKSRATKQEWYELQQAQAAYVPQLEAPKIIYGEFAGENIFSIDRSGSYLNNKCYFIPRADLALLALLNSRVYRFFIEGQSVAMRGNFPQQHSQHVDLFSIPIDFDAAAEDLTGQTRICLAAAAARLDRQTA
ncbi:MAG: N-6 DNA methylase, partial [Rhodospirillales bacterium]|nr:N-6 DNA methylase [Rhodospirillales bacterium]